MTIDVGAKAPDFTLKDQNNQQVNLAAFGNNQNVLLVFYPFAFSGICTTELCQVRNDLTQFQNADVQVLPISVDSVFTLKTWAQAEGFDFPLLSDFWPHGAVAQKYGVFNENSGMANRGTFVIDRQGIVRFAEMNQPGEPRDQAAWKKALDAI